MFGLDTQEKMPDEFLTNHDIWDGYIGHIWYNLLNFLNFTPDSSVVDVAPGSSIKLASALAKFGYRGNLYIVEASAEAVKALQVKYAKLLPAAKTHWFCGPLAKEAAKLPANPDYFLGNHILDDMILGGAPGKKNSTEDDSFAWASAYTLKPVEAFRRNWLALLDDKPGLAASKKQVIEEVSAAITRVKPAYVVLSQYPSSTLYDHGLGAVNDQATAVFEEIRKNFSRTLVAKKTVEALLGANRHFGNAHIGEHVLNPDYWMLCRSQKI